MGMDIQKAQELLSRSTVSQPELVLALSQPKGDVAQQVERGASQCVADAGANPAVASYGHVAQQEEQALYKGQVDGSNPSVSTNFETTDEKKLNKTERRFLDYLRSQNYRIVHIQSITLKIGDDCRYTPDFISITPFSAQIAWEVKGFFRDDAKVKLKVAARMYPWIVFKLVRWDSKNNQWDIQIVRG